MGWHGAAIGDFHLMLHDSFHDYIKDGQPKEYYENYKLEAEFKHYLPGFKEKERSWMAQERNCEEWNVGIPLLRLGYIEKLRKNYRFHWKGDLNTIMWEEINNRGFTVEGYVGLGSYHEPEFSKAKWSYYYLTSPIGQEPIYLQSPTEGIDMLHQIKNKEEHEWIIKNGLSFFKKIIENDK